ncbi:hypothetical protein SAMN06265360_11620 [Haloechinothrix alba]|uniref:Uncharacterized protein n=1 Tax=Haloechinothrix alba TaxID=664784 RepID=A0A238YMH3_9PSEU|nr:hypothetical protein [Haloechinothrix alba]SNR72230.1 hypothetical protein SAMN06265360_11620 [Haloechinothrix alba]
MSHEPRTTGEWAGEASMHDVEDERTADIGADLEESGSGDTAEDGERYVEPPD